MFEQNKLQRLSRQVFFSLLLSYDYAGPYLSLIGTNCMFRLVVLFIFLESNTLAYFAVFTGPNKKVF
jgi:hypothetical protein